MKKQILSIGKTLSRAEQKEVFGGNLTTPGTKGNATCYCNSGVGISSAPNCLKSTCDFACFNQQGYNGVCIIFD